MSNLSRALNQTNMEIPIKEVEVYQKEVSKAEKYALDLVVSTPEEYAKALAAGTQIKERLAIYTSRKEEITKPLNFALKSVRDLFRPVETAAETALATIKRKMVAYNDAETKKADAAKLKVAEALQTGKIKKVETAVRKIENIVEPPKTLVTDAGSATVAKIKKYRVVDKTKVPLDFLEVDLVKVKNSFRAGMPVAGCEEYEESNMRF